MAAAAVAEEGWRFEGVEELFIRMEGTCPTIFGGPFPSIWPRDIVININAAYPATHAALHQITARFIDDPIHVNKPRRTNTTPSPSQL